MVGITETWLDCSINTSKIFPDCFMVQIKDSSRRSGGVLLAHGVELSCVRREDFEANCKLLWCELVTVRNPKKSMLEYIIDLQQLTLLILKNWENARHL